MKRMIMAVALALVLVLALAAPAFAVSGADGAGEGFGQMHAEHAREGMLDGEMNPGVMHRGFSGWPMPE